MDKNPKEQGKHAAKHEGNHQNKAHAGHKGNHADKSAHKGHEMPKKHDTEKKH